MELRDKIKETAEKLNRLLTEELLQEETKRNFMLEQVEKCASGEQESVVVFEVLENRFGKLRESVFDVISSEIPFVDDSIRFASNHTGLEKAVTQCVRLYCQHLMALERSVQEMSFVDYVKWVFAESKPIKEKFDNLSEKDQAKFWFIANYIASKAKC